jgi:hypothetical protein
MIWDWGLGIEDCGMKEQALVNANPKSLPALVESVRQAGPIPA